MKPSSIISLIIAVLLIVVGLTTCIIGQNMAKANGELLFSEVKSDGLVNTVDLTDTDISKIELIVNDAEINLYGKSASSYIEFVNFRENYYTLTTANRVLSFDEIPDIISMLKFWENGFSFKGMRYIFHFQPATEGKKVINVYLSSDVEIKIFDITAKNSTLNMENLTYGSDYNLDMDNGEVNVKTLKTTSSFRLKGTEVALNMSTAVLSNTEIEADKLEMKVASLRSNGTTTITCKEGSIDLTSAKPLDTINLDLHSKTGDVTVNGVKQAVPYRTTAFTSTTSAEEISPASIVVKTDDASISLRQSGADTSSDETNGTPDNTATE